jgi:hypothetical protein
MRDLMTQAFNYGGEDSGIVLQRILDAYPPHKRKKVARDILREGEKRKENYDDFFVWATRGPFSLGRNNCSRLHDLRDAARVGTLLGSEGPIEANNPLGQYPEHTFVVKHDWARAFDNAEGVDDSVKLPYDICAFEFLINGRAVIAVAYGDMEVKFTAFAHCRDYWLCVGGGSEKEIAAQVDLLRMIWSQIRAICIALDAEVATHTVERASNTLNKKRVQAGKAPICDFHVVDLARRHRVENPPECGASGNRKRMHFRRGHWRHYETSKTWIRWCLVGDPDLGFIHKDYTI